MGADEELVARVGALGRVAAAAFAAAAANRAAPLFRAFHGETPCAMYEATTARLWEALIEGDLDEVKEMSRSLETMPEAINIEGDSDNREYYAAWALDAYQYVALSLEANDTTEVALHCIQYALDLASNIEAEIGDDSEQDGPIAAAESEAERRCCTLLESEVLAAQTHAGLLAASGNVSRLYAEAVPIVASRHRWTVNHQSSPVGGGN